MRIGAVFSQADSGTDPDSIRQWAIDAEAAGFERLLAYDHVLNRLAQPGLSHAAHLQAVIEAKPKIDALVG